MGFKMEVYWATWYKSYGQLPVGYRSLNGQLTVGYRSLNAHGHLTDS